MILIYKCKDYKDWRILTGCRAFPGFLWLFVPGQDTEGVYVDHENLSVPELRLPGGSGGAMGWWSHLLLRSDEILRARPLGGGA